jgi:DNA-binding response OmpR family regulator
MARILIIGQESETLAELCSGLVRNGFGCSVISYDNGPLEEIIAEPPDMVLMEMDGDAVNSRIRKLVRKIKPPGKHLPLIALVSRDMLDDFDDRLGADDVLISPYDLKELVLRIKLLLYRNSDLESDELIKCDDLLIDLSKCEVTLDGVAVELTFKEYELLKFLARNRGRVYTRQALLNNIWGYDYFSGDRTVDVHIRRLRSKIEDSRHSFIETVRSIGYRFRADK